MSKNPNPAELTVLDPAAEGAIPHNLPGVPDALAAPAEAHRGAVQRRRIREADASAADAAVLAAENADQRAAAARPDNPPAETAPAAKQAAHDAKRALAGAIAAEKAASRELQAAVAQHRDEWRQAQVERIAARAERLRGILDGDLATELQKLAVEESVLAALDEQAQTDWWGLDMRVDRTADKVREKADRRVRDWARMNPSRPIPMDDLPTIMAALRFRAGRALGDDDTTYGAARW